MEILEKTRALVGEGLRFYTKIKATVTTDKMEELAQRIKGMNVAQEYKKLQSEYARLSRELEEMKQIAAKATASNERQLALERIKRVRATSLVSRKTRRPYFGVSKPIVFSLTTSGIWICKA